MHADSAALNNLSGRVIGCAFTVSIRSAPGSWRESMQQFSLRRFVLFSTSCSGSTRASASARTTEKWLDGG
jgi:hypothetical protein